MPTQLAAIGLYHEIGRAVSEQLHEVLDVGTHDEQACDLPDYVYPGALALARGEVDRAIFVDGVGYGSAMIANKLPGVFAAVAQDPFCAGLARAHSNTNALCIGGKIIGSALALEVVRSWMTTDYLGATEPKYARRVAKVTEIAERHIRPL